MGLLLDPQNRPEHAGGVAQSIDQNRRATVLRPEERSSQPPANRFGQSQMVGQAAAQHNRIGVDGLNDPFEPPADVLNPALGKDSIRWPWVTQNGLGR